ncbi:MAG: hypothetical protein J2P17_11840, partial [Mycobacterium sp.]|nr:hypothetical protein [Mycobacterium sp.]
SKNFRDDLVGTEFEGWTLDTEACGGMPRAAAPTTRISSGSTTRKMRKVRGSPSNSRYGRP